MRMGTIPSFSRQPTYCTNPQPLVMFCRCLHGPTKSRLKSRRSPARTTYHLKTTMLRLHTHGRVRANRVSRSISTTRCSSISTVRDEIRNRRNGTTHSSTSRSCPFFSVMRTPLYPLGSTPMCSKHSTPWGFLLSATEHTSSNPTLSGKCLLQLKSGTTTLPSQDMRNVSSRSWPTASSAPSRLTSSTRYMRFQTSVGRWQ